MSNKIQILIQRLDPGEDIELPEAQTDLSAGVDLSAAINSPVVLAPGERKIFSTGFAIALPEGFEAQIRPRSGLAIKNGITVLNSPGTIDADYRGEIGVILINLSATEFIITRGMRIAQMVVSPVLSINWSQVEILTQTGRGNSGFGSTGPGKKLSRSAFNRGN